CYAHFVTRADQVVIQSRHRYGVGLGQVEICRVVSGQSMFPRELFDTFESRVRPRIFQFNREQRQFGDAGLQQSARDAPALFSHQQSVEYLVWPECGSDRRVALLEPVGDSLSKRGIFIGETPGQHNRRIEHKPAHRRPSLIRSLILSPRNDSLCRLPKPANRSATSATEAFPPDFSMRSFSSAPSSRETLVSCRAASIRAHWATSSSRVTVTLRRRLIGTRIV